MDADGRGHTLLVMSLISGVAVCADCIAHKADSPRWQIDDAIQTIGRTLVVHTSLAGCTGCFEIKVVHKIES